MRITSRILQVLVILLGALFLYVAITSKMYLVGAGVIAITIFGFSALGFSGIDPTLKNPAARGYFRLVALLGIFVIAALAISLAISLLNGELRQAGSMFGYLLLICAPLWRYRQEIPGWLRK